ncbi:MAG: PDZ domain-containing protein [Burkholderiales bacterium]
MSGPPSGRLRSGTPEHAPAAEAWSATPLSAEFSDLVEPSEIRPGVAVRWGAVVRLVAPDGRAARAGLLPGDVVLALNGRPVRDARQLTRAVEGCDETRELTFSVLRRHDITTVHMASTLSFDRHVSRSPEMRIAGR